MSVIFDRIEKGREQLQHQIEAIQGRQKALLEQSERALTEGREKIRVLEANALEQALELLVRANGTLDDRSALLKRGERALAELLVTVRSGQATTLPVEGFDELSIKNLKPLLEGLKVTDLKAIRAYEVANKNRVTLLREIDTLLDALQAN